MQLKELVKEKRAEWEGIRAAAKDAIAAHQPEPETYALLDTLPSGSAPDTIVEGCIVLEGGAFRGVYGEGVLDALMLNGVNLQTTIGVSAGALNGFNYVAGQIGRAARMNLSYRHDGRYVGPRAFKENRGVFGFDFAFFGQDDEAGGPFDSERFHDPRRRFLAVVANLETGKAEYHDRDEASDIFKSIQASASMPYLSEPVQIDGVPYLDGGCCDKIPIRWAIDQGFEKIVVVKTQDHDYRKKPSSERSRAMANRVFKEYPAFAEALVQAPESYNAKCDDIERLAEQGRIFVIEPSEPVGVGRLEGDMDKLGALYWRGFHDAVERMDALKEYLGME